VSTAEHPAFYFYAMPDDPARAMAAPGRDSLNCALETVEGMSLSVDVNLKAFVVFISANFAGSHPDS
jgi:hypothetical protein